MPVRRTPRPLRGTTPKRVGPPDMRDHDAYRLRNGGGARPSQQFDWDAALLLHALSMDELGYPLSRQQQKRIDDHA